MVSPGFGTRTITQPTGAYMPPRSQQFYTFFQPLIDEFLWRGFSDRATQYFGPGGRFFPSVLSAGTGYAVSFEGENSAWVSLNIRTADRKLTKHIFDDLVTDREGIESSIAADPDTEWHWNKHNNYDFSSINVRRSASIDDSPEKLEETRAWMLDMLPKLKELFEPRVEKILRDL